MKLAELDFFPRIHIAGGPQHDEQGLAVPLELRTLVTLERIFDGERMQPELLGNRVELLGTRAIEPDPGHSTPGSGGVVGGFEGVEIFGASSVDVHAVVDQSHGGFLLSAPPRTG